MGYSGVGQDTEAVAPPRERVTPLLDNTLKNLVSGLEEARSQEEEARRNLQTAQEHYDDAVYSRQLIQDGWEAANPNSIQKAAKQYVDLPHRNGN